ncbi:MAG: aromatic amino acid transport family protein [Patescibacteria group bacterium]
MESIKKLFSQFIFPTSLLAGTIIGAGMFALPYLFEKSGIILGLLYLIFFSLVFALMHLMYADIIIRTPENHRFPGYAGVYLGKFGFWSSIFMAVIGAIFVLTVYLILSASFINLIFPNLIIDNIYKILFFWLISSAALFFNVNKLTFLEFLVFGGMVVIIFIIFISGILTIDKIKSYSLIDLKYAFLPYGAILFSMYGRSAIPTVLGYFRNNNQSPLLSKWPIILGSIIPSLIYIIFIFGIFGLSNKISEDAVSGLVGHLPFFVLIFLGVLGIISLWSTYIMIGRDIKKTLEHDFKLSQILSGLIVVFIPIILYLLGFKNFLKLIEISGGIIIGLEGLFLILMWLKASKINAENKMINNLHPLIIYPLLIVFIGGIVYKLVY